MNYGKALKIVRSISGIQQRELASLLDLDSSYISLIESGKRQPSLATVSSICKKLNVPIHLFTLLAAEPEDVDLTNSEQMTLIGESLARFLVGYEKEARSAGKADDSK